ncbi:MAG: antitoxin, partial [Mycobacteriales bacterium]
DMSTRLQVVMEERELEEVRQLAQRHGLTVSEWTRQVIRSARRRESVGDPARKLHAIRSAAGHAFPVGDISSMLADIERGYLGQDVA